MVQPIRKQSPLIQTSYCHIDIRLRKKIFEGLSCQSEMASSWGVKRDVVGSHE